MDKTLMIIVVQEGSLVNPVVTLCWVTQSCLTLMTQWTVACQAPLSMGILQASILEWVAMPFPQGIFPTQESNLCLLCLLDWLAGSLPLAPHGKPQQSFQRILSLKGTVSNVGEGDIGGREPRKECAKG